MKPYYQDDAVTIYHGDCREVLPMLEPVDLLLTDPPYGIAHKSNGQLFRAAAPIAGDESLDLAETVREWARQQGVATAMFFSPYRPMTGWRTVLCWAKGAHVGIGGDRDTCWKRDFEMIGVERNGALDGTRDSGVVRINAVLPPPTGHVAEKPLDLMLYLLRKLGGATVLDPFMGSGTTLRAAKDLGRKAIGIEIEERYCEIAAQRMSQEVLPLSGSAPGEGA